MPSVVACYYLSAFAPQEVDWQEANPYDVEIFRTYETLLVVEGDQPVFFEEEKRFGEHRVELKLVEFPTPLSSVALAEKYHTGLRFCLGAEASDKAHLHGLLPLIYPKIDWKIWDGLDRDALVGLNVPNNPN